MKSNRKSKRHPVKQLNRKAPQELMQPLERRQLLSITPAMDLIPDASSSTVAGYSPSQIASAYGYSSLSFNSGKTAANGAGQTIAIVDAYNDPNIAADLKTFDSKFGLATASLKVVNQTGGSSLPATSGAWAEEISLDVEWAHAIAPGASLLLVETNSSSTSDLLAGVNYARGASGVSVVSMSWGGSEFAGETSYDSDFTTPSGHTGVTFIAASGDNGSAGGVDWPASSPDVLSVGGTALNLTSAGAYSSETGWSDSGGGASVYEGEPEYQSHVQSLDVRTVPDVSADANPSTGVAVYDSLSYDGSSGWVEFGGTSAAAPQWAGLISIADQGRVLDKLGTLAGSTNTLPTLYSLQSSASTDSADFHDITSGATSFSIAAGTGYDEVTGIGSPKANNLIPALVSSKINTALTQTAVPIFYPPGRFHFGFFVSVERSTFAGDLLSAESHAFSTTLTESSQFTLGQSFVETSIPQMYSIAATAVQELPIVSAATISSAEIAGGDLSQPVFTETVQPALSDSPGSESAIAHSIVMQALAQDLVTASAFAHEMVSQLVRDAAIDLVHSEAASAVGAIAEALTAPESGWRSTVMVAGMAIALGSCVYGESRGDGKKEKSPFSDEMIRTIAT